MPDIEWQDLEAIKRLEYNYQRCLDTKQWDELRKCFMEDAKAACSGGKLSFASRDAMMQFLQGAMGADTLSLGKTNALSARRPTRHND